MKYQLKRIFVGMIFTTGVMAANAQYPDIPSAVQRSSDSLLKAAKRHSDSAWNIAYPIIKEEAKNRLSDFAV